jgi:hypothetical protein
MTHSPQYVLLVFSLVVGCTLDGQVASSRESNKLAESQMNSITTYPVVDRSDFIDVPPGVRVRCPEQSPMEGEPTIFYADSTKLPRASYKWEVNQGKITMDKAR